jgi:hypothetical protein
MLQVDCASITGDTVCNWLNIVQYPTYLIFPGGKEIYPFMVGCPLSVWLPHRLFWQCNLPPLPTSTTVLPQSYVRVSCGGHH